MMKNQKLMWENGIDDIELEIKEENKYNCIFIFLYFLLTFSFCISFYISFYILFLYFILTFSSYIRYVRYI
jgi:hypothetical protein